MNGWTKKLHIVVVIEGIGQPHAQNQKVRLKAEEWLRSREMYNWGYMGQLDDVRLADDLGLELGMWQFAAIAVVQCLWE